MCPVEADPAPLMQWIKDGHAIHSGWQRFRVVQDGALRIKDVQIEDAGRYVCKATNGFGSINVNYSLIVIGKFFWTIFLYENWTSNVRTILSKELSVLTKLALEWWVLIFSLSNYHIQLNVSIFFKELIQDVLFSCSEIQQHHIMAISGVLNNDVTNVTPCVVLLL